MNSLKTLKDAILQSEVGYDFIFRFARTDEDFAFLRASRNIDFERAIATDPGPGDSYKKVLKKTQDLVTSRVLELGLEDDVKW